MTGLHSIPGRPFTPPLNGWPGTTPDRPSPAVRAPKWGGTTGRRPIRGLLLLATSSPGTCLRVRVARPGSYLFTGRYTVSICCASQSSGVVIRRLK